MGEITVVTNLTEKDLQSMVDKLYRAVAPLKETVPREVRLMAEELRLGIPFFKLSALYGNDPFQESDMLDRFMKYHPIEAEESVEQYKDMVLESVVNVVRKTFAYAVDGLVEVVQEQIGTLREQEQAVLKAYFFEGMTLSRIGSEIGGMKTEQVTGTRAGQMRDRALLKLRADIKFGRTAAFLADKAYQFVAARHSLHPRPDYDSVPEQKEVKLLAPFLVDIPKLLEFYRNSYDSAKEELESLQLKTEQLSS